MILGTGIDRIEIGRVRAAWQRHGERFRRRVYTQAEWDYCLSRPDPAASLAARFSAKEATMKALGLGWGSGIRYADIEVTRGRAGKPGLKLHNNAERYAQSRGATHMHVSLTHDRTHAMAIVLIETIRSNDRQVHRSARG
jgi:holo-[acyl-carrier protein] synthase